MVHSYVFAWTCAEEVLQVNGWRGEMKTLEVNEPESVRGPGVPEEHIVDPEVAVYEHVESGVVPPYDLLHAVQHHVGQSSQLSCVPLCKTRPRVHGSRHRPQGPCAGECGRCYCLFHEEDTEHIIRPHTGILHVLVIHRRRDSSVSVVTRLRDGRQPFDSRQGQGFVLFATASRTALGPTQSPMQWVSAALFLATHFHLMSRLRMRGPVLLLI